LEIIEKIIAENGRLPGEDILKNIPGIAFIPGLQKNVQAFAPLIFAVDRFRREDSPGLKEKLENINKSSDLAYVLYTSGSTGAPKGVMVEHRNLNYLLNGLKEAVYKQYPGPIKICLVSPTIFDASIKQIFASLLLGHSLHIVPENMRKDIHALVNFYEKNRIDLSDGTPTHLRMMLECMETESTPPPSVSHFLIGGEPLLPKLVGRFFRHYESVLPQITNVYGPTECTVDSSSHSVARDTKDTVDSPKYIPIGKPLLNCRIYILNEVNQLQPIGIVGELCISGSGVSRGYLNRPELTFERFVVPELHELTEIKKINKSFMGGQGGLFQKSHLVLYRTGDLARWLPGGDIECLGRVDRQVKVRGYRIELGEIENRLEKIEYIKKAEVIVRESIEKGINGEQIIEKYICAYITAEKEINSSEIKSILSERLPAFMIPTYIIQLDKMPISPTGKVDRKALPEPQLKAVGNLDKPINETEKKLAEIWSEVLNINENAISMESDFFELGGHSLKALNFIAKVHKVFNVKLAMSVLFDIPTIRGIAAVIGDLIEDKFASIGKAEKKEYYPLSSAQKRLYVLQQFDRQMVHYNMPYVVLLKGPLDMMRVETAFKKLIRRHESLRTSFGMIKTELVQIIQQEITFAIQYNAVSNAEKEKALVEGFITPFDLSRAPLLRVGLISRERDVHILMLDIHHIISDAISHGILVGDFIAYYYGKQLPVLEFQYKDYAEWQQRPHMDKGINAQEKYWLNEFAGEIPALNLPNDYPRPAIKSFEGRFLDFTLNQEETRKLMQMIHTEKVTLFIILAAVYSIFLHKLSNQEDILFGTPVAGRKHVDLEKIIGVFVNTLVLRIHLPGEETFREFLTEVRDKIFKTFENQDFQFDELVEKLDLERDTSSNPLFNVMFSLQNAYEGKVNIPGGMPGDLRIEPYSSGRGTIISKFDFTLHALEKNDCLYFGIEYCVKLFKEETILRFSQYFTEILSSVINSPGKPISSIEILSLEERKQLLFDFNDTGAEYPHDKTINQLFEEQAERTPDGIAVFGCGRMRANTGNNMIISYRQLNEQSGQLALLLIEKNVRTDTIVSIIMERSLEMIIGIISILKAGGAYLPIDPTYPQERIDYMLKDSNAKILITDNEKRKIDKHQLSIVNIQLSMSEHPRRELLGLKECHGRGLQHSAFIPQHSNH
ncbi:MAG TPA: condensation domain-containing protein, partial [Candidatus Deferrimicrobium sp.]|nr:condensation domain-containing protein [Candidatus Deferrimicrobium sp.]